MNIFNVNLWIINHESWIINLGRAALKLLGGKEEEVAEKEGGSGFDESKIM